MNKAIGWGTLIFLGLLTGMAFAADPGSTHGATGEQKVGYGKELGTVTLPFSCEEPFKQQAQRGLALLHHMTYDGARNAFESLTRDNPDCAMGYWGQAMSYIHPLWSDPPDQASFEAGKALAAEAKTRARDEKERAFASAVEAYYAEGQGGKEENNLVAFETGWRSVYERFPQDPEAATFYALAHLATANPADKSYATQKESARIAKGVLERFPDHPGAHHYAIHALDYPPLAREALAVARSYGRIAPEVPHALHMPGHIFTRLGLWEESIAMNRRSADAALEHPADGKIPMHYLHALDYLTYAYLQRGEDERAEAVREEMSALEGPYEPHVASAYALAAVPARLALERDRWSSAARLQPQKPENYPWDGNPAMEAITHFAKGLGATRSGDSETAREAVGKLASLEDEAEESSAYWGNQVKIQRLTVEAWLNFAEGKQEQALKTMREAAQQEAATEKHPVTPGEVLPAHELLGDMLLEMERYPQAQESYESALQRSPNRLNSLYGAGRAAELAGDKEAAGRHYSRLVEVVAADTDLPQIREAKAFLAETK